MESEVVPRNQAGESGIRALRLPRGAVSAAGEEVEREGGPARRTDLEEAGRRPAPREAEEQKTGSGRQRRERRGETGGGRVGQKGDRGATMGVGCVRALRVKGLKHGG